MGTGFPLLPALPTRKFGGVGIGCSCVAIYGNVRMSWRVHTVSNSIDVSEYAGMVAGIALHALENGWLGLLTKQACED
jgi:hypothetical protein